MNGTAVTRIRQENRENSLYRPEVIVKEYLWGTEEWLVSREHRGLEEASLMIKRITARQALSIQVHPDDEYAKTHENSCGKTEMWLILDCEPDAFLYYGLKHKITKEEFQKRIKNHTIAEVCKKVTVKKNDVFYIPSGMVHAIGKGITLLEIQQSSNITYRIFDYGRRDSEQRLRELHIPQAKDVMSCTPAFFMNRPMKSRRKVEGGYETVLVNCPYFQVMRIETKDHIDYHFESSFLFIYVTGNKASIIYEGRKEVLQQGECVLLRGSEKRFLVEGNTEIIVSEVKDGA